MSDMKCPFCQQELLLSSYRDDDTAHQMWSCLSCQLTAQRKIWQELINTKELLEIECAEHSMCHTQMLKTTEKLERTRKALAFAKSKLNGIHRLYSKAFYTREDWLQVCMEMVDKANTALDKIKALEQKD